MSRAKVRTIKYDRRSHTLAVQICNGNTYRLKSRIPSGDPAIIVERIRKAGGWIRLKNWEYIPRVAVAAANNCGRCGGSGYVGFPHVQNGVCFNCNKDGHIPHPRAAA